MQPRPGSLYVQLTRRFHGIPMMVACVAVMLGQGGLVDYYLIRHHRYTSFAWLAFDVVNLLVFLLSFLTTKRRVLVRGPGQVCPYLSLGWLAWLLYAVSLVARWSVIFVNFSWELREEHLTLGPNALKVTLAVSSLVFFLLLVSNHDSRRSLHTIPYIEELTGSVVFDIVDTVDILDVLFEPEAREEFPLALETALLGMSGINILLPAIPLAILSLYDFGRKRLPRRLVVVHKLMLAFAVNLPYLVLRLVLWLKYRVAISPFCVKNVVVIVVVLYGFFTHKNEEILTRERQGTHKLSVLDNLETEVAAPAEEDVEGLDEVQLRRKPKGTTAGDAVETVEENTSL